MMEEQTLNLIEIFASVQGETSLTGFPTTFIRLAACNLRCVWCDTKYSFGRGDPWTLGSIYDAVKKNGCKYVCVTGGEPLLQNNVHPLMNWLCENTYIVSLETGGGVSTGKVDSRVKVILDVKCPGSGMSEKNCWDNLERLNAHDEVKFVIAHREDYEYALSVSSKYNLFERQTPILLSPVFNVLEPKELVDWMLKDRIPSRLNLQVHKYIWHPETKGV